MDATTATAPAGQAEAVTSFLRLLERHEADAAMELLTATRSGSTSRCRPFVGAAGSTA